MYEPRALGTNVLKLIQPGRTYIIHSLFDHGLNLQVDHQDLIYLGDDLKGIVPFGIHLEHNDFKRLKKTLKKDSPVAVSVGVLKIADELIQLTKVVEYNNFLTIQEASLKEPVIITGVTGLDFLPAQTFYAEHNMFDLDNLEQWLKMLIGSGQGLTPAGDDFLIGALAINAIKPFLPVGFNEIVTKLLAKGYTTDVSKAYLKSALNQQFSSIVKKVVSKSPHAIKELSASGSTSGVDTLSGINWGLKQAFKEE